jgi:hypothetical protein
MTVLQRAGIGGPVFPSQTVSLTVPNITAAAHADVAAPANAAFIGATGRAVDVCPVGAPLANLGIVQAWVSNGTTGVVTTRFTAFTGNVTTAAQSVLHCLRQ